MRQKSATMPATQATGMKTCVMQSGGGKVAAVDVLKLSTAPDVKCVAGDGTLHLTAPQYEIEFWLVHGARSVNDAVGQVSSQIVDEFKDFKPDQVTDLTIAGLPARQLIGAGHEADDGDPGDADVIVFQVGKNIFIACYHGESLTGTGQQGLVTLVRTAQIP